MKDFLKSSRFYYFIPLGLIIAVGTWLRIRDVGSRGLEYDEIWTLINYARNSISTIFTDVATPNNHVLNSLLIKFSITIFGDSYIFVRLPALVSGLLIMLLVPCITMLLCKDRLISLLATSFCAFNGGFIYYSQNARGYSIQALLILIVATGFLYLEKNRGLLSIKSRSLISLGIFLSAILSILTLPTSILYLFPICLLHSAYLFHKFFTSTNRKFTDLTRNCPELVILYCMLIFSCGAWYGLNWDKFAAGKSQFGNHLTSFPDYWLFAYSTIKQLTGIFLLLATLGLLFRRSDRLIFSALIIIVAIPFASAFLTTAGPPRVYLPLIPFIAIGSSCGLIGITSWLGAHDRLKIILVAVFSITSMAIAPLSAKSWMPIDWKKSYLPIRQSFPPSAYICFPSPDGLPICFNVPSASKDTFLSTPKDDDLLFIHVGFSDIISGIDASALEKRLVPSKAKPLVKDINGIPCAIYRLVRLKPEEMPLPNETVIMSFPPANKLVVEDISFSILEHSPDKWIILNHFLESKFISNKENFLARVLATDNFPLTQDDVSRIMKFKDCKIHIYAIKDF